MSFGRVAVIGLVLASPALWGMYEGSVDPDAAGIRLAISLVVAVVVDRLLRVFVSAAAPSQPARQPVPTVPAAPPDPEDATPATGDRRR